MRYPVLGVYLYKLKLAIKHGWLKSACQGLHCLNTSYQLPSGRWITVRTLSQSEVPTNVEVLRERLEANSAPSDIEQEARGWLKSKDLEMLLSGHVGASGKYLCELFAAFHRHMLSKEK